MKLVLNSVKSASEDLSPAYTSGNSSFVELMPFSGFAGWLHICGMHTRTHMHTHGEGRGDREPISFAAVGVATRQKV